MFYTLQRPIIYDKERTIPVEKKETLQNGLKYLDYYLEHDDFTCGKALTIADISLFATATSVQVCVFKKLIFSMTVIGEGKQDSSRKHTTLNARKYVIFLRKTEKVSLSNKLIFICTYVLGESKNIDSRKKLIGT